MIHSRGNPLPSVICYTKEQLSDLKSFLSTPDGVIGVDRTFSLGKCFVTTTVFKSHKVLRKGTGEPPILIGPLLLHWDGKQENYYRFFAHLRGVIDNEISNIEIIMGSDDEKALTNAIDQAFPGVKRKLCSKHIKDNIIRQMTDKIPKSTKTRSDIVGKLFGENGVAKADDSAMFDERNNAFKQELIQNKHDDFLEYYEKHVQEKISEHVVNQTDQLWTNNNTESINHRLKVLLQWKPRKTNELIDKLYDLVKMQTVDMRRALYGTGNFVLNHRFQKFKLTKIAWSSKSENEKSALLNKFLASGLNAVQTSLTSRDGKYSVNKVPRLATKPHQRTRCRPNRTPKK
jgi:transposase-like protein